MKLDMRRGDCLDVLPQLAAGSVHCCVTSPPYWGLRDYGTATWEGGDEGCDHQAPPGKSGGQRVDREFTLGEIYKDKCGKCGARRIDSQLGLEATPEEYVAKMVEVFRAVKRVLRDDGTLWLNMGEKMLNKEVLGMPWLVAFALKADGWCLRSDIIWHKPNPMPEICTDRPTKSHEYLFLLTKSARYFYDADAIKEAASPDTHARYARGRSDTHKWADGGPGNQSIAKSFEHMRKPGVHPKSVEPGLGIKANSSFSNAVKDVVEIRNKRSVWTIPTQSFSGAHFATFPEALVLPCILAGTSEEGCCAGCGAPYVRVTEREQLTRERPNDRTNRHEQGEGVNSCGNTVAGVDVKTIGWRASCDCFECSPKPPNGDGMPLGAYEIVPCTVLDPFLGSGTTAKVSQQYGRSFVGCELSAEYLELARDRFKQSRLF